MYIQAKPSCHLQSSPSINSFAQQTSLQVLKPVLKSKSNVTQIVAPSYSDSHLLVVAAAATTTTTTEEKEEECYYSTRTYTRNSSFSSTSSSSSVHFNPEVIEIEYQPEYPVSYNHYQEQEEDDILWSFVIQFIASLNYLFSSLFIFKYLVFYQNVLFLPLLWFKKRNTNK